jgi:glycosyltransferase involved in cell wall biosynthesis
VRIAFDLSSTRGEKTGIGVYTGALVRALRQHAPHHEAVALDDGAGADQRTDRRIFREQVVLPRLASRAGADLVHLTGFAAPLRSRVPVVLTVMDLIGVLFTKSFPLAARFYWGTYLPRTLRAARHIVAPSHHTKRDVVRLAGVPADRVSVVAPGVEERFRPLHDQRLLESARARLALPARYFLFVSTLEPRKGIDTLLAAYRDIAAQVPEDLVIVGKRGWDCAGVDAQVREARLERRVHFTDYVADDHLPAAYNLATAFVFPSRYEGFGLTPLEAMACGTPVVCSDAASLPEVVGDAGILIPPGDTTGYGRAMSDLSAGDAQRAELRRRGLVRAAGFTWERAALETDAVYQRVLQRAS